MDDPITTLRMLERIIAVLIGGLAIYLGYRLFFHLPFERSHEGELQLPGVKIVLSRVGPGVFFAAFGSLVLYYSLTEEVKVSRSMQGPAQAQQGQDVASGDVVRREDFTGAASLPAGTPTVSPTGAAVTPQRRAKALTSLEMLNCAQRLLARDGSSPELQGKLALAIRDGKRALMLSIWDEGDWGPQEQLGVMGLVEGAPFQLRSLFDATYEGCPK